MSVDSVSVMGAEVSHPFLCVALASECWQLI